jgi:hypothetical protein
MPENTNLNKKSIIHDIMCRLFGHKWRYNFPISSIPNKAICKRCYSKSSLNLNSLDWEIISDFENEKRTDKEIATKWFSK